jgi:hypothetical protein
MDVYAHKVEIKKLKSIRKSDGSYDEVRNIDDNILIINTDTGEGKCNDQGSNNTENIEVGKN